MNNAPVGQAWITDPLATAVSMSTLSRNILFNVPLTLIAESLCFAGRRLLAHGELMMTLAQATSPMDVLAAQANFTRVAIKDCSGGAFRLAEAQAATAPHIS